MANINFTRLFTSLGYLCGGLNEVNTYMGTTLPARVSTLLTQFEGLAPYAPLVSTIPSAEAQTQNSTLSWVTALSTFAQQAIINEVAASRSLASPTFANSLAELVRQMTINSQTLQNAPCSESLTAVGSPTGDESFVVNMLNAVTAIADNLTIPDNILVTCSQDQSHGATVYREPFTLVGQPSVSPLTNYAYGGSTQGTSLSTTVTAVDPASQGGVVNDPGFAGWGTGAGSNTPTNWSIYSGTAGTNVFQVISDPRSTGASSLSLVGDGSTVVKVRQAVSLTPGTAYALNYRVYMKTDESSHWQVSVSLTNSSGTAVAGPNSYSNVVTTASSASLAGSWANVENGVFVAPAVIPSGGCYLEIRLCLNGSLTSAAQAGATAYVDYVSLVAQSPLYAGGPSLTIFSGQTAPVQGDQRTLAITFTSSTIPASLLRGIDRLVGGLAVYYPTQIPTTSGSPTQSNSLVT